MVFSMEIKYSFTLLFVTSIDNISIETENSTAVDIFKIINFKSLSFNQINFVTIHIFQICSCYLQ